MRLASLLLTLRLPNIYTSSDTTFDEDAKGQALGGNPGKVTAAVLFGRIHKTVMAVRKRAT